uniref:Polysaccharide pyruvyl transferase family protein n=1 Tax=Erysipelothrix tonsillarum TaxID=38402 RepID=A0A6S6I7P6_9FIRM|nr:polysaccharide pyruvyl transferase family protein [Erysipelothrix tonsillarum]
MINSIKKNISCIFKDRKLIEVNLIFFVLMVVASFSRAFTYIGILVIAAYSVYLIFFEEVDLEILGKNAIFLVLFQNFCIGIGAHLFSNSHSSLSILTQVPTMFIVGIGVLSLINNKISKFDKIFGFYFIILIIYFVFGTGPLMPRLVYVRNFTVFYFSYQVGKYCLRTSKSRKSFLDYAIFLGVISGIFGIVGMIFGKQFYLSVGVLETYVAKRHTSFTNGIPANFRTIVGGNWVQRLPGLFYDPVNYSYFAAAVALFALLRKKYFSFVFLIVCSILTFGKGGLFVLIGTLLANLVNSIIVKIRCIYPKTEKYLKHNVLIVIGLMLGSVLLIVSVITVFAQHEFGTFLHFYGALTGFKLAIKNPFGHGLGSAGNLVRILQDKSNFVAAETGLINMMYQIGVLPVLLFIYMFSIMVKTTNDYQRNIKNIDSFEYRVSTMFIFVPIVLLLASLFQENTLGTQCISVYMILQGSFENFDIIQEKEGNKMKDKKKIAIVTLYYNNYNYGGQLQAYAMQKVFSNNGYEAELIRFELSRNKYILQRIKDLGVIKFSKSVTRKLKYKYMNSASNFKKGQIAKFKNFDIFMDSIPHTNRIYDENSIKEIKDDYDIFVVGSDQTWNPGWWNDMLLLNFVDSKRKYSYAASIARDTLSDKENEYLKNSLSTYDGISLRESQAQKMVSKLMNLQVEHSLDPTILLSKNDWSRQAIKPKIQEEYALIYMVGNSSGYKEKIYEICKQKGLKVVSIAYAKNTYTETEELYSDEFIFDAGPSEWLGLFENASYVFTDSFHGSVFSIIFGKNFSIFERDNPNEKRNGNSRIYSFLEIMGLQNRLLKSENISIDIFNTENSVDFVDVGKKLNEKQTESLAYINEILSKER